jgi:hypothetical protein
MVARGLGPSWEIIMRKLTVAAVVAILAASLVSFVPWHSPLPDTPLGSISPHALTLASPAIAAGEASDAF